MPVTSELVYDGPPPDTAPATPADIDRKLLWLRDLRTKHAEIAERFDSEIARLKARRADALAGLEDKIDFVESQLADYHAAVWRDAEDQGQKPPNTIKFAYGTLRTRSPSSKIVVDAGADEWDSAAPWTETTHRLSKSAVAAAIKDGRAEVLDDRGRVMWVEGDYAGTVVGGAQWVLSERTFKADVT